MWWFAVMGAAVIVFTLLDLVWTVLASSLGAGPLSKLTAATVRRVTTLGSLSGRRRQVAGYVVMTSLPFVWLAMFVVGFAAILYAGGQVKADYAGSPGPLAALLFAYGVVVALGSNYNSAWQALHFTGALLGIVWSSLSLTYVMQIVAADRRERSVASGITALGDSPYEIIDEALKHPDLGSLPLQVVSISSTLSLVGQDHLAYPVLKYVQAGKKGDSTPVAVARFDETVNLLDGAVRDSDNLLIRAGRSAVNDYIGTLSLEDGHQPPRPEVSKLTGPPERLRTQDDLDTTLGNLESHRAKLTMLLQSGGASWADVYSAPDR